MQQANTDWSNMGTGFQGYGETERKLGRREQGREKKSEREQYFLSFLFLFIGQMGAPFDPGGDFPWLNWVLGNPCNLFQPVEKQ